MRCDAEPEVVSDDEALPKIPKRPATILEAEGVQSPAKTSRLLGAASSSGQPSNADLMSMVVKMMETHDATTAQNDLLLKTIVGRVDSHDDALVKMARKVEESNDKMDNIELGRLAEGISQENMARMAKDIADRMEAKMEARMAALEQETASSASDGIWSPSGDDGHRHRHRRHRRLPPGHAEAAYPEGLGARRLAQTAPEVRPRGLRGLLPVLVVIGPLLQVFIAAARQTSCGPPAQLLAPDPPQH